MTKERLTLAGWLSIVQAVLLGLSVGVALVSREVQGAPVFFAQGVVTVPLAVVSIYVLLTWKGMLNERFRFNAVDTLINILVVLIPVILALNLVALLFRGSVLGWPFYVVMLIASIVAAVIRLVYAKRLLNLGDDLSGLLRLYCFVQFATVICVFTIILAPGAVLTGIASCIITTMIFFRTAERPL